MTSISPEETETPEPPSENPFVTAGPAVAQSRPRARNRPRAMSAEEVFLNQDIGNLIEDFDVNLDSDQATGTHTRPGMVQMWKPSGDGRTYTPRMVPEGNRAINLKNGWLPWCPDCRTNHEASPYPAKDANSCPAREMIAVRVCPVCSKRISDNMAWVEKATSNEDAPDAAFILRDDSLTSTPESRTRMQLNIHLWTFHATQARLMGIPPIPQQFSNPALPPQEGTPLAAVNM